MTEAPRAAPSEQWLEQVDSALRTGGMDAGSRAALQALADGVEHPLVFNLAASAHYRQGRFDQAAQLLERARALSPNDAHVLNSLGVCQKALGRMDSALQSYDAAVRLDSGLAAAHFNRGTVLEELTDIKGARSAYERAAELDHRYVEPLASLAWLDALAGDVAAARERATRALALAPANVLARMALASADVQQGELEPAATGLFSLVQDPALSPVNRSIVLGLVGDLQDAEGNYSKAFAAYQASNEELRALHAGTFEAPGQETALGHVRRLADWFGAAESERWRTAPPAEPGHGGLKAHIFLVGFPRSGTTLLENVLAAHPEVVSLEEKDCLEAQQTEYLSSGKGLERLSLINSEEATRHREAYWTMVRSFGVEPRGRVFIDKMPLNSVLLPIVAKLFPKARVLFARRDPRDVVLSCFRRRFALNASMYELLTLVGTAAYYDAVMSLSELYRGLLPLPQHVVRYESLVDDFEATARSACDFLGLEWDKRMTDFATSARTRGIGTPSAAQVARGLNREGQGTWLRYKQQMAPVLPLLEPWVERFGYR